MRVAASADFSPSLTITGASGRDASRSRPYKRPRRGNGLPAPMQALGIAPKRQGAEFLAPVGKVEAQNAAMLCAAGVTIDPCPRGFAVLEMLRRRRRRVGWNRRDKLAFVGRSGRYGWRGRNSVPRQGRETEAVSHGEPPAFRGQASARATGPPRPAKHWPRRQRAKLDRRHGPG